MCMNLSRSMTLTEIAKFFTAPQMIFDPSLASVMLMRQGAIQTVKPEGLERLLVNHRLGRRQLIYYIGETRKPQFVICRLQVRGKKS